MWSGELCVLGHSISEAINMITLSIINFVEFLNALDLFKNPYVNTFRKLNFSFKHFITNSSSMRFDKQNELNV